MYITLALLGTPPRLGYSVMVADTTCLASLKHIEPQLKYIMYIVIYSTVNLADVSPSKYNLWAYDCIKNKNKKKCLSLLISKTKKKSSQPTSVQLLLKKDHHKLLLLMALSLQYGAIRRDKAQRLLGWLKSHFLNCPPRICKLFCKKTLNCSNQA